MHPETAQPCTVRVEHVATMFVHQQWPHVAAYLEAALTHADASGEITIDQLRADLGQGRAALYRAVDDGEVIGAAAVVFQNQRSARVAFVSAIGGVWIAQEGAFEQFAALLRQAGATRIAGAGRDSIVRLWSRFGLRKKYTVFEAAL
jgi:hypothetical protein